MSGQSNNAAYENIVEALKALEKRVQQLEVLIGREQQRPEYNSNEELAEGLSSLKIGFGRSGSGDSEGGLESSIGEYGLAIVGSVVLFFGITFMSGYLQKIGFPVFGSVSGYLAAGVLFLTARYVRNSFTHLSFMLNLTSYIIVYYVTLRLHFFTTDPLISMKYLVVVLMLIVPAFQYAYSLRKNSEFVAGIATLLILLTGLFTNSKHITLSIFALASVLSIYLYYRNGWFRFLLFSIFAVYLAHTLWLMNNPLAGQTMHVTEAANYNLVYLFAPGFFYSIVLALKHRHSISQNSINTIVIVNGIFFSLVILLAVFAFHKESFTTIFMVIFLVCFLYSIYLKMKTEFKFPAAFYVCYGFFALSVAVYGYYGIPDVFFLLALQSLLVVSMALWYRSQFIVVLNVFLYVFLLIVYLAITDPIDKINFAFAIVALVTARVLNWKKERLTLKTEMFRSIYLVAAFVMVLLSLYYAVPDNYITVSWSAAAVFFFIMSAVLKNVKYRWMALSMLLITVFYLFLVDLAHLEIGIRVIAFLLFGAVSIGASLFYAKKIKGKKPGDDTDANKEESGGQ